MLSTERYASVEAAAWNAIAGALWPFRDCPASEMSSAAVLNPILISTTPPLATDLIDAYELFSDWGPTDEPSGWFWPGRDEYGSGPAVLATKAGLVVLNQGKRIATAGGRRLAMLGSGDIARAQPEALVDLGPLARTGCEAIAAHGSVAALLAIARRLAVPGEGCWRLDLV